VPADSGAFSGPMSPRYPDNGSPHKRQNPSDQELGFLAGKSLKRQGDGENDMLRNLAISRLVKRAPSEDDMLRNLAISRLVKRSPYLGLDSKRAPYSGRRMAISRLIKKNREAAVPEYDVPELLSDIYSDDYIPQRIVKDADTSKFSALWKTRVGK
jgi:hypothetical protein